ncbi:MAG: Ig-like domain-containing protein [Bacteroidales bacterium]|nr:Ig-like domain-containing protein [Bacteroidales bacterium]
MKRTTSIYLVLLFLVLFVSQCAKISSPAGGAKDEDPPKIKKSTPENYSVNFNEKTIKVEFDEYVVLKEVNQKLLVSPPLQEKPEVSIKGKSLIIEIDEELIDNTTYTFNFNDAIVDNNESNPFVNYQYVFSTGEVLDSLKFGGGTIDAFKLEVLEDVHVLLYDDLSDSAIYKQKPLYVSKADENGDFLIHNLKADTFQLFALQDVNLNFLYDPEEYVAFSDSLIFLNAETQQDYTSSDSLNVDPDSLNIIPGDILEELPDSINTMQTFSADKIVLSLFKEEFKEQYLLNTERTRKENILFVFNKPLSGEMEISLPEFPEIDDWFLQETYTVGDTLAFWLTDTTLVNEESIQVAFKYPEEVKPDSVKIVYDTVYFRFKEPAKKSRRRNIEAEKKTSLALTMNAGPGNPIDLNEFPIISTTTPIAEFNKEKIEFYSIKDSIETAVIINPLKDSTKLNRFFFEYKWALETSYKVQFLPGAVTDIYGLTNDSIKINFRPRELEFYGNIIIDMQNIDKSLIIQLLTDKEVLVKQTQISSDTNLVYDFLSPKTYLVKAIWDENENGKWDTGNLIKHIQPEKIVYYLEEIKLRSNWDFKKNWSPRFNNK